MYEEIRGNSVFWVIFISYLSFTKIHITHYTFLYSHCVILERLLFWSILTWSPYYKLIINSAIIHCWNKSWILKAIWFCFEKSVKIMQRKVSSTCITYSLMYLIPLSKYFFLKSVSLSIVMFGFYYKWTFYVFTWYCPYKPVSNFEGYPSKILFFFYLLEFWQFCLVWNFLILAIFYWTIFNF